MTKPVRITLRKRKIPDNPANNIIKDRVKKLVDDLKNMKDVPPTSFKLTCSGQKPSDIAKYLIPSAILKRNAKRINRKLITSTPHFTKPKTKEASQEVFSNSVSSSLSPITRSYMEKEENSNLNNTQITTPNKKDEENKGSTLSDTSDTSKKKISPKRKLYSDCKLDSSSIIFLDDSKDSQKNKKSLKKTPQVSKKRTNLKTTQFKKSKVSNTSLDKESLAETKKQEKPRTPSLQLRNTQKMNRNKTHSQQSELVVIVSPMDRTKFVNKSTRSRTYERLANQSDDKTQKDAFAKVMGLSPVGDILKLPRPEHRYNSRSFSKATIEQRETLKSSCRSVARNLLEEIGKAVPKEAHVHDSTSKKKNENHLSGNENVLAMDKLIEEIGLKKLNMSAQGSNNKIIQPTTNYKNEKVQSPKKLQNSVKGTNTTPVVEQEVGQMSANEIQDLAEDEMQVVNDYQHLLTRNEDGTLITLSELLNKVRAETEANTSRCLNTKADPLIEGTQSTHPIIDMEERKKTWKAFQDALFQWSKEVQGKEGIVSNDTSSNYSESEKKIIKSRRTRKPKRSTREKKKRIHNLVNALSKPNRKYADQKIQTSISKNATLSINGSINPKTKRAKRSNIMDSDASSLLGPNIYDTLEPGNLIDVLDFSNSAEPLSSFAHKPFRCDTPSRSILISDYNMSVKNPYEGDSVDKIIKSAKAAKHYSRNIRGNSTATNVLNELVSSQGQILTKTASDNNMLNVDAISMNVEVESHAERPTDSNQVLELSEKEEGQQLKAAATILEPQISTRVRSSSQSSALTEDEFNTSKNQSNNCSQKTYNKKRKTANVTTSEPLEHFQDNISTRLRSRLQNSSMMNKINVSKNKPNKASKKRKTPNVTTSEPLEHFEDYVSTSLRSRSQSRSMLNKTTTSINKRNESPEKACNKKQPIENISRLEPLPQDDVSTRLRVNSQSVPTVDEMAKNVTTKTKSRKKNPNKITKKPSKSRNNIRTRIPIENVSEKKSLSSETTHKECDIDVSNILNGVDGGRLKRNRRPPNYYNSIKIDFDLSKIAGNKELLRMLIKEKNVFKLPVDNITKKPTRNTKSVTAIEGREECLNSVQKLSQIPEDNQALSQIPEDNQALSQLPDDNQALSSEIPDDNQALSQLPDNNQALSQLPDDNQMLSQLPDDNQASLQLPEYNQALSHLPEDSQNLPSISLMPPPPSVGLQKVSAADSGFEMSYPKKKSNSKTKVTKKPARAAKTKSSGTAKIKISTKAINSLDPNASLNTQSINVSEQSAIQGQGDGFDSSELQTTGETPRVLLMQDFITQIVDGKVYKTEFVGRLPDDSSYRALGNIFIYETVKDPYGRISAGYLRLEKGELKRPTKSKHFSFVYTVLSGVAEVKLENTFARLSEREFFYIPVGLEYSIKNVSASLLLICYTRIKADNVQV